MSLNNTISVIPKNIEENTFENIPIDESNTYFVRICFDSWFCSNPSLKMLSNGLMNKMIVNVVDVFLSLSN